MNDGFVRFWVQDNGDGIRTEEQPRLFNAFTRLEQARARGHGLGLSIVKRIVERLNGEVGIASPGLPGQGSTFYFTLPERLRSKCLSENYSGCRVFGGATPRQTPTSLRISG